MRLALTATALVGAVALVACGGGGGSAEPESPAAAPWFEDVAARSGIAFTWISGHTERFLLPEIMGGGAALFDADGDGDLDVYLVQGGRLEGGASPPPGNRLFRNDPKLRFTDVSEGSGADDRGYGMGVASGDYDGDGDADLYVTNVGPNVLLRNDGGFRFTDVTSAAGVGHAGWGTSAAFFDYDLDSDLDLFVLNYLRWSPRSEIDCHGAPTAPDYCSPGVYKAPAPDVLYRNEGDGTFVDVSAAAGLHERYGTGLGVTCGDFDGDGLPDVFVANDGMMNQLWINQGDGTFVDRALEMGVAVDEHGVPKAGMGVGTADLDDDGDLDLLVGNLEQETDSLFRNEGRFFRDQTAAAGISIPSSRFTRFGLGFVDFDNDGWLDLYAVSGAVRQLTPGSGADPYAQRSQLFRGTGPASYALVANSARDLPAATSRAAAFGDLDDDGGVDVLVVNRDAPAMLLHNVVPHRGHWLTLRVVDARGADALGATVTLAVGARRLRRDVRSAYSYLASNDPRVHFGLGPASRVEDIVVRWPDGVLEAFGDLEVDRAVTLERGTGERRASESGR